MGTNIALFDNMQDLQAADNKLQLQIDKDEARRVALEKERWLTNAKFKIGDIVSADVGMRRGRNEAVMIVDVTFFSESIEDGENFILTDYRVMDKNGRQWNLYYTDGTHKESKPDDVQLIKRAK